MQRKEEEESLETLKIEVEHGTKVKFLYPERSHLNYVTEHARYHLLIGSVYTVDYTVIHAFHTEVFLIEVPGIPFGSCMFVEN